MKKTYVLLGLLLMAALLTGGLPIRTTWKNRLKSSAGTVAGTYYRNC